MSIRQIKIFNGHAKENPYGIDRETKSYKAASDIPRLSVGNLYVEASMEHG